MPTMYVSETICDNREKRRNSAKRNFTRSVYESVEHNNEFEVMLDEEIRNLGGVNPFACGLCGKEY